MGGSFNPAHDGHIYISQKGLELLDLDEVWWFVAKQNPLKAKIEMDFASRVRRAKDIIEMSGLADKLKISEIELEVDSNYTFDTLTYLLGKFKGSKFVWLMGADSLLGVDKWYRWQDFLNMIPLAVFNRGDLKDSYQQCAAYQYIFPNILEEQDAKELIVAGSPSLCFLNIKVHPESATRIRNQLGN